MFSSFLQNKEFVCRGYDYERLEDFQQRMLGEFPQAIAMQHPNQPDDTILQSDAQCILLILYNLQLIFSIKQSSTQKQNIFDYYWYKMNPNILENGTCDYLMWSVIIFGW